MAEYAIFLYHPDAGGGERGERVEPDAHDRYAAELDDQGVMRFGRPLAGPASSVSLRGEAVTEGPFVETAESIVGFYVVEAPDLEAAVAIARRNPILLQGGGLEVRPVEG